ncbi:MAG: hypothetical protein OXO50_13825 [Caldilineaceae bacterium]|nr:hypothetical protein [Caldilineaceae bacterium]MDE0196692.1 hypothetical protein [Caldilineaceae bacterium]
MPAQLIRPARVRRRPHAASISQGEFSIEISSEENTITLVGDIPGITPQSRLEFEVYDFLHGHEQVTCRVSVDGR